MKVKTVLEQANQQKLSFKTKHIIYAK